MIDGKPLSKTQKMYCSRSCGAKGTKSWTYKTQERRTWDCKVCGVTHYKQNSAFCSKDCKLSDARDRVKAKCIVYDSVRSAGWYGVLKSQLVRYGFMAAFCMECGLTEWRGFAGLNGPLQLDHINGDRRDNRLENLRILCANCHTLTDTYCGRNKGTYIKGI